MNSMNPGVVTTEAFISAGPAVSPSYTPQIGSDLNDN
jgi:hypothetical protein